MNSRSTARALAAAVGLVPLCLAGTASAQTIKPIVVQKPDLVVSSIVTHCGSVAVTVRNDGSGTYINDKPIVVNMIGIIDLEGGVSASLDKALSVTHLNQGATSTVSFATAQAPLFRVVEATVDTTSVIGESNETNNKRSTIDNQTCPVITVSDARVTEGGQLKFTATIDRRPAQDATFTWSTRTGTGFGTATAGGACASTSTADYVTASGSVGFSAAQAVPTPRTITVNTCGDLRGESAETLSVVLASPRNATLKSAKATGTIDNQAVTLK